MKEKRSWYREVLFGKALSQDEKQWPTTPKEQMLYQTKR
jgi:hypothetical protein